MMQRTCQRVVVLCFLLLALVGSIPSLAVEDNTITPKYTGLVDIAPSISISSGTIYCNDVVTVKSKYTANLTWELQQGTGSSFSTVSTWKESGTGTLSLSKMRLAMHGNSYRLRATAKVYDSNGRLVDNVTKYSATITY